MRVCGVFFSFYILIYHVRSYLDLSATRMFKRRMTKMFMFTGQQGRKDIVRLILLCAMNVYNYSKLARTLTWL